MRLWCYRAANDASTSYLSSIQRSHNFYFHRQLAKRFISIFFLFLFHFVSKLIEVMIRRRQDAQQVECLWCESIQNRKKSQNVTNIKTEKSQAQWEHININLNVSRAEEHTIAISAREISSVHFMYTPICIYLLSYTHHTPQPRVRCTQLMPKVEHSAASHANIE